MKASICRIAAVICVIMMLASFCTASADWRDPDGWLNFNQGGFVCIPTKFADYSDYRNNYSSGSYDFYYAGQQMWIWLSEEAIDPKWQTEIINSYYSSCVSQEEDVVKKYKSEKSFAISGYTGREMFYIQYVIDHGVLYTLEMRYPTANRKECDKIVANVTDSIHYTGSVVYTGGYRPQSRSRTPSSADLDRINACIKYPNYDFMYLDHYVTATVTHKAVYCFRDPDRDVWRDGNFYKVYKGTEVTILAESQGYACVIINGIGDAGWINLDYLSKR